MHWRLLQGKPIYVYHCCAKYICLYSFCYIFNPINHYLQLHLRTGKLNLVYFGPQTAKSRTGVLTYPPAIVQSTGVNKSDAFDRWRHWPTQRAAIMLGPATLSSRRRKDAALKLQSKTAHELLQCSWPVVAAWWQHAVPSREHINTVILVHKFFFIIVISYLKFFHHISQKTQICITVILIPKMNFIYNYFQPLWGKDLLHTKEVSYGALYLNIWNILFLHGCLSSNWRNIYTLCKPLGVFCSLWMTNVVAVMCFINLFGMDYNYCLFNRWRCISYCEYLYKHFLSSFLFLYLYVWMVFTTMCC